MTQRVFDTFLFSEPMETEVLLAKLHSESPIVEAWVAVENSWTTKGEPKRLHLKSILQTDLRFERFRDRLHVVELDTPFTRNYRESIFTIMEMRTRTALGRFSPDARRAFIERPFFFSEQSQRNAAWPLILDLSGGQGRVLVSDVDEMLDTSTVRRKLALDKALASGAWLVRLPRKRFVYDFDNILLGRFRDVPLVDIESIQKGILTLGESRATSGGYVASPTDLVYEYSYCYGPDGINRKLQTFAHVGTQAESIIRALECNHVIVQSCEIPPSDAWCEAVTFEEGDHPSYVADNFNALLTRVVNTDYAEARRRRYPGIFSAPRV